MIVYVVTESFGDYDEGWDMVLGVYSTEVKASKMRDAFDMACEAEYEDAKITKKFLWGQYHNHAYDVETWEVED